MKFEDLIRKIFPKYKSKYELQQEIKDLIKKMHKDLIMTIETPLIRPLNDEEIIPLYCKKTVPKYSSFPIELERRDLVDKLAKSLDPYIEWKVEETPFGTEIKGKVYVAKKRGTR